MAEATSGAASAAGLATACPSTALGSILPASHFKPLPPTFFSYGAGHRAGSLALLTCRRPFQT